MGCPTGAAAGTSTSYPSVLEQVTVTGNFEPPPRAGGLSSHPARRDGPQHRSASGTVLEDEVARRRVAELAGAHDPECVLTLHPPCPATYPDARRGGTRMRLWYLHPAQLARA